MPKTETTTTTAPIPAASLAQLRVAAIRESPFNPRASYDKAKLQELADSIREKGVLQPVLVRNRPAGLEEGYELVFGHRRLRAAKAAGLAEIPAMVCTMDDKAALEAQLIENCQREDVPPLEEADGYKRLHTEHGYSAEELAAAVGKSKAFIYGRLKLTELCKEGRKALAAGELDASRALLVARIPDKKQQAEAAEHLRDNPGTFREAAEFIQRQYMLRLEDAKFSKTDADLVPKAGPCTTCPKRTGNQRELFGDVKSGDLCTDAACFRAKLDEAWRQLRNERWASGRKVLEDAAAAKVLFSDGTPIYGGPYVTLDQQYLGDPKQRTYGQLLGAAAPETSLARSADGVIVELLHKSQVDRALEEAGFEAKKTSSSHGSAYDEAQDKRRAALKVRGQVARSFIGSTVKKLEDDYRAAKELGGGWWRTFLRALIPAMEQEALKDVVRRRGLEEQLQKGSGGRGADKALDAELDRLDVAQLVALATELVLTRFADGGGWGEDYGQGVKAFAKWLDVDLKAAERDVKRTEKEKAAEKKSATGKKGGRRG